MTLFEQAGHANDYGVFWYSDLNISTLFQLFSPSGREDWCQVIFLPAMGSEDGHEKLPGKER